MSYLQCGASFHIEAHSPHPTPPLDVVGELAVQDGHEVDELAHELFPDLLVLPQDGTQEARARRTTSALKTHQGTFSQPTFLTTTGLLVRCDFLQWDEELKGWILYEVKATSSVKPDHHLDLAFQSHVLGQCGLKVVASYVLHLDKTYRKNGSIDSSGLLTMTEVTSEVESLREEVGLQVVDALRLLSLPPGPLGEPPASCSCWKKSRSDRCTHFDLLHPAIPSYSSFDVRVLGKGKDEYYTACFENKYLSPADVPDSLLGLTGKKSEELILQRASTPVIDKTAIEAILHSLTYPLYFLDYETVKWAIPRYDATGPYQQIPFQYSLHVLTAPPGDEASRLLHHEFLWTDRTDPIPHLAEKLMSDVGSVGSVLVWNKSFETTRNREMGLHYPASQAFFADVNTRVYDLMEVFSKKHYLDPRFKGSASIKNVLPVLVPSMSYEGLTVSNGGEAMSLWPEMVFGSSMNPDQKELVRLGLLEYCGQDTLAMVKIFEELWGIQES